MRRCLGFSMLLLGLAVLLPASVPFGCITVVQEPGGGTDTGTDDNTGGSTGDGGSSTDDDSADDDVECDDNSNLRLTYVNESATRVVFVENHRNSADVAISARILSLQPAGSSGSSRVECTVCPHTVSVRNIAYFDTQPSSDGVPPSPMPRGQFSCGGGVTVTFHADKTATITVDD